MKKILLMLIPTIFILFACGAPATSIAVPTNTPAPLPTETSIPPTINSGALLFQDEFEGSLDSGWEWLRENNNDWSLTNNAGWLEIMAGFGSINGGNVNNLLLRPIPEGNFELETRLKFKPAENQQIAGLLIYENAANHIQFGYGLCDAPQCAGEGLYLDLMTGGSFDSENFATKATGTEIIYLRLRLEGNIFTAYASENGQDWNLIGAHNNEIKPLLVGLVAGGAFNRTVQTPAQFDYFVINTLP